MIRLTRRLILMGFIVGIIVIPLGAYKIYTRYSGVVTSNSSGYIRQWFLSRDLRPSLITDLGEPCPDAPFLLPSSGLVGLLYADPAPPYTLNHRHTGLDIFGDGRPGEIPIVAAYEGYLTRKADWVATVIIRHDDPLRRGRTIWTYYTHMANTAGTVDYIEFPRGTYNVWVEQGQVIGYQGDYGGNMRVGLHLHVSIVKSDGNGDFLNEAILDNTLDPTPYFGMELNAHNQPKRPAKCS